VWLLVFVFLFLLYLLIMFLCSVTLWQPAVFYSVLVLYLRTQSILKPTYLKDCKHYNQTYCYFVNQFSALSDYIILFPLTMNRNSFEKELCSIGGVEQLLCAFCVSTCLHYLNFFTRLQFSSVSVSISEGVLNFISHAVVNTKTRLKISNAQQ